MHKIIKVICFILIVVAVVFFIAALKIVFFGNVTDAIIVFKSSANLIYSLIKALCS